MTSPEDPQGGRDYPADIANAFDEMTEHKSAIKIADVKRQAALAEFMAGWEQALGGIYELVGEVVGRAYLDNGEYLLSDFYVKGEPSRLPVIFSTSRLVAVNAEEALLMVQLAEADFEANFRGGENNENEMKFEHTDVHPGDLLTIDAGSLVL